MRVFVVMLSNLFYSICTLYSTVQHPCMHPVLAALQHVDYAILMQRLLPFLLWLDETIPSIPSALYRISSFSLLLLQQNMHLISCRWSHLGGCAMNHIL